MMGFKFPHPRRSARSFNVKFGRPYRRVPGFYHSNQNLHVSDLGDKVQLSIDFPGVKASDLYVHVQDRVLFLSGTRAIPTAQGVRKIEQHRRFRLDNSIDSENVKANLSHGILVVTAPKLKKGSPTTIPVTAAKDDSDHGDQHDYVVHVDAVDSTSGEEQKPDATDLSTLVAPAGESDQK
jgi:HSP20 family molecular chaperone IbpA